jgi:hypothetical protein
MDHSPRARTGGAMTQRRWFGLNAGASNWLWLSVLVMALDQWTKWLVVERFEEFDRLVLLPVLELMRLHNTGAAFSFLSDAGGWQRWVAPALAGEGAGPVGGGLIADRRRSARQCH